MGIKFTKMHGAGNDFVVIDKENCLEMPISSEIIVNLCDRKRGIGADGLIVLENIKNNPEYDAKMFFFNSDGKEEAMCGNGLRCAALYAFRHFSCNSKIKISTDSGALKAEILSDNNIRIEIPYMQNFVKDEIDGTEFFFGSTGVPHAVIFVPDAEEIDLKIRGRELRYHLRFQPKGTNVDFVSLRGDSKYFIRTYEKGVEDETSSCGTGTAAAGICAYLFAGASNQIEFSNKDSDLLKVEIPENLETVRKVFLTGPAVEVFSGDFS